MPHDRRPSWHRRADDWSGPVVEALGGLPGLALVLGVALQVPAGEVDAHRIAEDQIQGLLGRKGFE